MKKKISNTRGFPLVMIIIGFLLSAICVSQEFIAMTAYNKLFTNPSYDYVLMRRQSQFFSIYNSAIILFVLSFVIMVMFIAGARRKTTGYKEGVLIAFFGTAIAIPSLFRTLYFLGSSTIKNLSSLSDGDKYRAVNELICYAGPILVCLFIFLAGFGLIIKVKTSKAYAQIIDSPVQPVKQPNSAPVASQSTILNNSNTQSAFNKAAVPTVAPSPVEVSPMTETIISSEPVTVLDVDADNDTKEEQVIETEPILNNIICSKCGKELAAGTKFCRNCGVKIE